MNKEVSDALHMLLHCALKDKEFETQKEQFHIVYDYIEKLENIINEYDGECRRFKAFCRRVRRTEKEDVDEFNQGQEQKCNEFLNLLSGEKHWSYEGKYFDETDKEIEEMRNNK